MAFEHIIKHYNVPACIGRRVIVDGEHGVIAEDQGHYIGVLFDRSKPNYIEPCHPTWEVEYLEMGKVRKMTRSQKRYQEYLYQREWNDQSFAEWMGFDKASRERREKEKSNNWSFNYDEI